MKKDFRLRERVVIQNTGSALDGCFGDVLGKSAEHVFDTYIIWLDNPLPTHEAVTIPEGCLFRL